MARLYPKSLYEGATRPILREEALHVNQHDIAYRRQLEIESGAFKDTVYPTVRFTTLGALTSGTRVGSGTQVRGGSV